jgi:hypothetical protein
MLGMAHPGQELPAFQTFFSQENGGGNVARARELHLMKVTLFKNLSIDRVMQLYLSLYERRHS